MKNLSFLIKFFAICLFLSIGTHIVKAQDSDSDGITDVSDLDDDNDGIPDAEESPDCFYTVYEANRIASVISTLNGGVGDPAAGSTIPLLYNDNPNDGTTVTAYNFAALQTITSGSAIFTVQYPTPVVLKSLTVTQAASGMAASGFAKLYGSNDGVAYTLLTTGAGISISGTNPTFTNTSATAYLYYQIRYIGTVSAGNATSVAAGTAAIHEIASLLSTTTVYVPSAHPKPGICSVDTDIDGIPNHLDTDSDGDTCPDAYEGGATSNKTISILPAPYGTNGLANAVETSADSGQVSYVSTYAKYASNSNQNLCSDTDNDGVPNPIDIDDDNDGVLDTTEGDFCGRINRNIRVGYLASGAGDDGLASNMLLNLNNFGPYGTYNKTTGITLVPFATEASITEASLLANNIDVFFVGSSANPPPYVSTDKVSTALNTILINWAKNNNKSIFALQNNAIDYGYTITNNNVNPNTPAGTIGTNTYTNGYWPTPALNQSGSVQMTIQSSTRQFDILMTDANLRPVVITDREYNLLIFPDATIYNAESGMITPTTNDQKAIADTWTYFFDRFVAPQCSTLDTDGDGTPNHLDLNSDGDTCSDALEAGATASLTPNFAFTSLAGTATDTNSDGLADIVDTNTNGIPNYLSTYDPQALDATIRKCLDSDGDILPDAADLDDDNDGILDTNEGNTCSGLTRNLRIGYLNTALGRTGLMINMLSNTANFGPTGTYDKIPGITFVPYATEAAITEAQLLADNIDIFYVGSSVDDAQTSADKLSTAVNTRILSWSDNNNKGVIVLQNNATDYGYQITNNNLNTDVPYGLIGDAVFTNGYWPESTFDQSGIVQMTIASLTRTYETAMIDANGKAVFARDLGRKIVFLPDATVFNTYQTTSAITNAELRIAADVWAYGFDVFLDGQETCTTQDTDADSIPNQLDLDSDNDGCIDALEGAANIVTSQLVTAASSLSVGTGSTASNQNLCAGSSCVDVNGIPTIVGSAGQGIGDSQNASISSGCFCYKPAATVGTTLDTKQGITALGRAGANMGNWPMVRKGAWTALEAKTKGFVVNRIPTTAQVNAIANPVEGMMVYDEEADCLKIYTTTDNGATFGWQCFTTQTCPDY
ncbi:glycosyl hydrolase family 2 protein [Chryseobacterium defluvii]|uniref:Thrombospondin type 3 repeat-containing protein n=1 Tax=Chryseobacterium defluvii TaxID=160396 RepID=A0A495SFE7_9FLAO|nr:hypothetical protein [Chryseobacterium defluvii]RKS98281.1 hypothetical protein BCF58_2422 [Chryseobacterium defluvii]